MKKNNQTNKIMLGFILNGCCLLTGQAAQAQSTEHNRIPISAEAFAREAEAGQVCRDAAIDLHLGNYARAEDEARQAEALDFLAGGPHEVLAAALEAQGKDQEALQAYHFLAMGGQTRDLLPYAGLLLKSGQWAQALAVYNQALPRLPDVGPHLEATIVHDGDVIRASSRFSPDVPEPMALATAIHIARGMVYNNTPSWGDGAYQNTEAMAEYAKALQTAPNNALANYYYGVGLQKLSPTERVKFGTAQQAKAALQKAVKIGNVNVKAAALKALKSAG